MVRLLSPEVVMKIYQIFNSNSHLLDLFIKANSFDEALEIARQHDKTAYNGGRVIDIISL